MGKIIKPDPSLQNNLMAFGFMCGEGWHPLIMDALGKIQKIVDEEGLDVRVTEIKEKYGGLRIYLDSYTDEIQTIIDAAEEKSLTTCEVCGKEAKQHIVNGWVCTRCDICLGERKQN